MNRRDWPSVSLVIATYNWETALEFCVRSAFRQVVLPTEIIIADDGSGDKTRQLIDKLKEESPVPLHHVWHPDEGFRLSSIRNKAFAKSSCDYIIQIDGDILLSRHFIQDHLMMCEPGHFVCGSRVRLVDDETKQLFLCDSSQAKAKFFVERDFLNSLRIPLLSRLLAKRYGREITHLRGCNMAFWRSDLIKVNGYNEDLSGWGHEDGEIALRLHFAGVQKKFLKFGGVCYHLYHHENSKSNEQVHHDSIAKVIKEQSNWCLNGLDKHLKA